MNELKDVLLSEVISGLVVNAGVARQSIPPESCGAPIGS